MFRVGILVCYQDQHSGCLALRSSVSVRHSHMPFITVAPPVINMWRARGVPKRINASEAPSMKDLHLVFGA